MAALNIIDFFTTLWGRVALGAGLVAALVAVRAADVHHQRSVGAQQEAARVEAKGKQIDATVQKRQRDAASQPADRVLGKWERP